MNHEIHISPKTLAIRFNGVFSATDRGHLAQELVRHHRTLKKLSDPKITFSQNNEITEEMSTRHEELCGLLGLPPDEKKREKVIQGLDGRLRQVGLPYYKINVKA